MFLCSFWHPDPQGKEEVGGMGLFSCCDWSWHRPPCPIRQSQLPKDAHLRARRGAGTLFHKTHPEGEVGASVQVLLILPHLCPRSVSPLSWRHPKFPESRDLLLEKESGQRRGWGGGGRGGVGVGGSADAAVRQQLLKGSACPEPEELEKPKNTYIYKEQKPVFYSLLSLLSATHHSVKAVWSFVLSSLLW